ncbi:MAG: hypothetical protein J0H49_22805 [Acidobacteria bacterium]|nr:hypothetical protein [Acidobacteriota bacterium]
MPDSRALFGLFVVRWATSGLLTLHYGPLDAAPDWRVIGFNATIALRTSILFGRAPA